MTNIQSKDLFPVLKYIESESNINFGYMCKPSECICGHQCILQQICWDPSSHRALSTNIKISKYRFIPDILLVVV